MRYFILLTGLLLWAGAAAAQISYAHAHNDYKHERPLLDALDYGFTSVEADVHLIDGELYVAHDPPRRKDPARTLRNLYLEPLRRRIDRQGGRVYADYAGPFYLMIDIKTAAEPTYRVLREQLAGYRDILTTYAAGVKEARAVTVFLSGNRPLETVMNRTRRLVAIDGRPEDLGKGYSAELMPVISDHYRNHFTWTGEGPMPEIEQKRLRYLCRQAKQEGKIVRFWASPEKPVVWRELLDAGVGFINTDRLQQLHEYSKR